MPDQMQTIDGGEAPAAHRARGGAETHGRTAPAASNVPAGDTMQLNGGAAPGEHMASIPTSHEARSTPDDKAGNDPPRGGIARRR